MRDTFADAIRTGREALGLTQDQLASQIGRSPSWMTLVEAGRRRPDLEIVPSLARALHKDPREFTTVYMHRFYPAAARVLFDSPAPEISSRDPETPDVYQRLAELPPELRAILDDLIRVLHRQGHA